MNNTRKHLIGLGVILSAYHAAIAGPSVDLSLVVNETTKAWEAYASVIAQPGLTLGLHGLEVNVVGSGSIVLGDSYVRTPAPSEFNTQLFKFFHKGFRIGRFDGTSGLNIKSSQESTNKSSTAGSGLNNILENIGISAFTEDNLGNPATDVAMPALVASGDFAGTGGVLRLTAGPTPTTLLPPSLPTPTSSGAAFTPFTTSDVTGHTFVLSATHIDVPSINDARYTIMGSVGVQPAASGGTTSIVRSLTVGAAGCLDLADTSMIIDYSSASPAANVRMLLRRGHSGSWSSSGITSSMAASHQNMAIGYAEASQLGIASFGGTAVDPSSLLLTYTRFGDTDLNGVVDFDDYVRIDYGFNRGGTDWFLGDFDYSGAVDFDDYVLMDASYNGQSLGSLPGGGVSQFKDLAPGDVLGYHVNVFGQPFVDAYNNYLASVPEPATLSVLGLAGALMLRRRGR